MDLRTYQNQSTRTMNPATNTLRSDNYLLGLIGELGETTDLIKKAVFHNHPLSDSTRAKVVEEIGDLMWYISAVATDLKVDLEEAVSESAHIPAKSERPMSKICRDLSKAISTVDRCVELLRRGDTSTPVVASARMALAAMCLDLIQLCTMLGIRFSETLTTNVEKLKRRYTANYSDLQSLNRPV